MVVVVALGPWQQDCEAVALTGSRACSLELVVEITLKDLTGPCDMLPPGRAFRLKVPQASQ